jgi:hypothetical protein
MRTAPEGRRAEEQSEQHTRFSTPLVAEQAQCSIGSWADLDALSDQLETIAAWKSNLETRIAIARLRFELVDADHDFSDVEQEVRDFTRARRILAWREAA